MEKTAKKAGFTVAAMILATLLSKLLGMLRQVMIASTLADSMEGVAFAAASKIPFAIFDMLFSAAVLGSFIPIYKGSLAKEPERARKFSASFLTCIAVVTAVIAVLGMIFSRQILFLAAPKLDEETAALAAGLLRIMFPAMIFAGAAYTLVGILQSHESFILAVACQRVFQPRHHRLSLSVPRCIGCGRRIRACRGLSRVMDGAVSHPRGAPHKASPFPASPRRLRKSRPSPVGEASLRSCSAHAYSRRHAHGDVLFLLY